MDTNHGGPMETVPALPYPTSKGDQGLAAEERERMVAAANTALEERIAQRERTEAEKAALRDEQAKRFRPRGNYLLVRMEVREKTAAGILLPDAKQEIPGHGTVVAVGPGVSSRVVRVPEAGDSQDSAPAAVKKVFNIRPGDSLFFSRFVGATLEFPDGVADARYRVMSEDEVYGSWEAAP